MGTNEGVRAKRPGVKQVAAMVVEVGLVRRVLLHGEEQGKRGIG